MLILTRKVGEKVIIGTDVIVTIVRIDGGSIRVGIEAPESVVIVRDELDEGRPS